MANNPGREETYTYCWRRNAKKDGGEEEQSKIIVSKCWHKGEEAGDDGKGVRRREGEIERWEMERRGEKTYRY